MVVEPTFILDGLRSVPGAQRTAQRPRSAAKGRGEGRLRSLREWDFMMFEPTNKNISAERVGFEPDGDSEREATVLLVE